jgi:hypothetical protein
VSDLGTGSGDEIDDPPRCRRHPRDVLEKIQHHALAREQRRRRAAGLCQDRSGLDPPALRTTALDGHRRIELGIRLGDQWNPGQHDRALGDEPEPDLTRSRGAEEGGGDVLGRAVFREGCSNRVAPGRFRHRWPSNIVA